MAPKFKASIFIDRPAEQVWSYLTDETNDPVWRRPYCKRVDRVGPLGLGTEYNGVDNMGPYKNVVTRFDPPAQLSWHEESPRSMQQQEGNYVLTREGSGTNMTLDLNYVRNGLQGVLMTPILSLLGPSMGRRLLEQLKSEVEKQPGNAAS